MTSPRWRAAILATGRTVTVALAVTVAAGGISMDRQLAARHASGCDELSATLTVREAEVLRLVARGLSNAEIAGELYLSAETIKTHVATILSKLRVRVRVQAVIEAYE